MQSKNIQYLDRLDHIRFLAAATVLLFHAVMAARANSAVADRISIPLILHGDTGVQLFMVISGLILTLIAGDKELLVSKFYLNRLLRIYPLFVFVVTLGYFATPDPRPTSVGIDYLMSLLPISNLYRLQYGAYGGHLWTIAVELQFYLLFPFLLVFKRRYGVRYILSLIGFLIVLRAAIQGIFTGTVHMMAFFSLFGNLEVFLIGMLAGDFYRSYGDRWKWWHRPWVLPASFIGINLIIYLIFKNHSFFHVDFYSSSMNGVSYSRLWIFWPTIEAVMWGGFVLVYLRSQLWIPFSSFLATLGKYSYSIYAWHIFVIAGLERHFLWLSPYTIGFFVIMPLTVILSAVSYHLIERPFLEMRVQYTEAVKSSTSS